MAGSTVTFGSEENPPSSKLSCHCRFDQFRYLFKNPPSDGKIGECRDCPDGATCVEGTKLQTIAVDKGFWRSSEDSSEIVECYTPDACDQMNGTQCTKGHEGPLSNICEDRYSMGITGLCEECNYDLFVPPQLLVCVFFLLIFVSVFFLVGWIRRKQKSQEDVKSYKELNPHKHVLLRPRRRGSTVDKSLEGEDDEDNAGNQFYHMTQNPGERSDPNW